MELKRIAAAGLFAFTVVQLPAYADADPTMHQIYEAAEAGHLDQAQTMMDRVLADHPQSGKAHYVAAELYAKERNYGRARDELSTADRLEPGLPFAKPESVRALREELNSGAVPRPQPPQTWSGAPAVAPERHFPLGGGLILLVIGIAIVAMMMRRRRVMSAYPVGGVGPGGMYGGPGGGVYGGPGPVVGGGMGSGIAGGLASGLAVGAGVVAGEELAHHFLDGDRHGVAAAPQEEWTSRDGGDPSYNSNMGGSDFGVSDSGSWDDGGSVGGDVGGGGGDDWS